jgi:acyl-CoA thioesterase I
MRLSNLCLTIFAIFLSVSCALADRPMIAMLGDSLTQGYGLEQKDGLVPQLQSWLDQHGHDVQILNAGVSGDTTAGGLARLDWTLTPNVSGLIVALGGNDMLRGIDPAIAQSNLEAILTKSVERSIPVLLIGMSAPGNYGADYKAKFDQIYPSLANKFSIKLFPDMFGPLKDLNDPERVMTTFMQADGIHPNAKGVAIIVDGIGPAVAEFLAEYPSIN